MSSYKYQKFKLSIPRWAAGVYMILALVLVPWTIYLARTLPDRSISRHWGLSWVGLDIAIMISLAITGILASLKSRQVVTAASTTAAFLIADAWFDISSAKPGWQLDQAIVLAIFIEIPLAIISYSLAVKVLQAPKHPSD